MTHHNITTNEDGTVDVETFYSVYGVHDQQSLLRTYKKHGMFVYQVWPNGATQGACEGLESTGPTLMHNDKDLALILCETLSKRHKKVEWQA